MTDDTHATTRSVRWEDPDGSSWWIISFEPTTGRYTATNFIIGPDGDEELVADAGFGDWHITSIAELNDAIGRTRLPEVVTDLEAAAPEPLPTPSLDNRAAPDVPLSAADPEAMRPPGARYRVDHDDTSWWHLGWD